MGVDGVPRLAAGDAIAGGTAHLLKVVRWTVGCGCAACGCGPGCRDDTRRGDRSGRRADVVVVDEDLRPVRVPRAGERVAPPVRWRDLPGWFGRERWMCGSAPGGGAGESGTPTGPNRYRSV